MRATVHSSVKLAAAALVAGVILSACGTAAPNAASPAASSPSGAAASKPAATAQATGPVLPVDSDPITNTATAQTLKIDSVLVENNVDASGKPVADHLEIVVSNTGSTELTGFEVFYTFTDPTAGISESYYTQLPDTFTVPAAGRRIIHFDNTGAPDHFPVNEFSLYATSTNALEVSVEVSAKGAAPQTATVKKDAGGAETSD